MHFLIVEKYIVGRHLCGFFLNKLFFYNSFTSLSFLIVSLSIQLYIDIFSDL